MINCWDSRTMWSLRFTQEILVAVSGPDKPSTTTSSIETSRVINRIEKGKIMSSLRNSLNCHSSLKIRPYSVSNLTRKSKNQWKILRLPKTNFHKDREWWTMAICTESKVSQEIETSVDEIEMAFNLSSMTPIEWVNSSLKRPVNSEAMVGSANKTCRMVKLFMIITISNSNLIRHKLRSMTALSSSRPPSGRPSESKIDPFKNLKSKHFIWNLGSEWKCHDSNPNKQY